MTKQNNKQAGAATLLFLIIMAVVLSLLTALTYSRLLLSIKRSLSQADATVANYAAESEVNDVLARLSGEYLGESSFPFTVTKDVNGTKLVIEGKQVGKEQTITVTGERSFAVSRIFATRKVDNVSEVDSVEMILSLDCTGSMDAGANCDTCQTPTRFDSQKEAALNFVDRLIEFSREPKYQDKFKLGIIVFGLDAKWLNYGGQDMEPGKTSLLTIKEAISSGFGSKRSSSPACATVMDATSIGSAFAKSHDYFSANKKPKTKQVEIVISDGEPNSRIPFPACGPSVFCPGFPKTTSGENYCENNQYGWSCHQYSSYKDGPWQADNFNPNAYNICKPMGLDFMSCTIATTDTAVSSQTPGTPAKGIRDPEVDAYAVTIFRNPPADVVTAFNTYLSPNGYYNATRATQLKNILNSVLNEILKDRTTIIIKKTPPSIN